MKTVWLSSFFLLVSIVTTAQYNTVGNAYLDDGCYNITGPVNWNSGAIWYSETIDLNQSFEIAFDLGFGTQDVNGADGIAFVMQPISNSEGGSGGGMGYVGIAPSLAVEMDTYENIDWSDPAYDHIAIQTNGSGDHATSDAIVLPQHIVAGQDNVEDGQQYYFRLAWDAPTNNLKCWINCDLRIDYTADIVTDVFSGNPNIFWGFTSATGGLNNAHAACPLFVSFEQNIPDVTVCNGETQQVFANDHFINHQWSPASFFDNPNIDNPTIIETTSNSELYWQATDACGNVVRDTFNLIISGASIPDLPTSIELCYGETLSFDEYGFDDIQWNNPITPNPVITESLNVNVDVSIDGCTKNQLVNVLVKTLPELDLSYAACKNNSVSITGNYDSLNWLSSSITGNSITITEPNTYEVEASLSDCIQTFTLTTDTLDCAPIVECTPIIPSAFSPNADGINDQFRPQITSCKLDVYKLSIYNRWGQQIFSTTDSSIGWGGNHKGNPVPIGVYMFVLEYKANGLNQSVGLKGNVTIIR